MLTQMNKHSKIRIEPKMIDILVQKAIVALRFTLSGQVAHKAPTTKTTNRFNL